MDWGLWVAVVLGSVAIYGLNDIARSLGRIEQAIREIDLDPIE